MFETYVKSKCPVILYKDGRTHAETIDYLLWRNGVNDSKTVESEARNLTSWLNFLHENGTDFFRAGEQDLKDFKEELLEGQDEYKPDSINKYLSAICNAYWFCETKGLVRFMIGIPDIHHPERRYRIEVHADPRGRPGKFKNPFLLKTGQQAQLEVPTMQQVFSLKDAIAEWDYQVSPELGESLRERDKLILRWLVNSGLRRREIISLKCSDIPKNPTGSVVKVRIVHGTKNKKPRAVSISKELIEHTLRYVENEREHILEEKRDKFGNPRAVAELFVNGGNNTSRAQMSAIGLHKWIKKLDPSATLHGLRRFALTRYAAALCKNLYKLKEDSADARLLIEKDVMIEVMQQAGHNSLDTTIKFYVSTGMVLAGSVSGDSKENLRELINQKKLELTLLESNYEQADLANLLI